MEITKEEIDRYHELFNRFLDVLVQYQKVLTDAQGKCARLSVENRDIRHANHILQTKLSDMEEEVHQNQEFKSGRLMAVNHINLDVEKEK